MKFALLFVASASAMKLYDINAATCAVLSGISGALVNEDRILESDFKASADRISAVEHWDGPKWGAVVR